MPIPDVLYRRLAAVTASLKVASEQGSQELTELHSLLARSVLEDPANLMAHDLSLEHSQWQAVPLLAPALQQQVEDILAKVDPAEPAQFRVFRREAPLSSPLVDLATPQWARVPQWPAQSGRSLR